MKKAHSIQNQPQNITQDESLQTHLRQFIEKVSSYIFGETFEVIEKSLHSAARLYEGKKWIDGKQYLLHALRVGETLSEMGQDTPSLISAILHNCTGKQQIPPEIESLPEYPHIKTILDGSSRLNELEARTSPLREVSSLRRMVIGEAKDLRILFLHLAEKLDVIKNISCLSLPERNNLLDRCTKLYAPLSARLGIHMLRSQFEDIAFMHTNPDEYKNIKMSLSKTEIERENYIRETIALIKEMLARRGIKAEVYGRVKHLYSIYQKMLRQKVSIDGIYDIIAFRVIVDTQRECWEVLGIIHGTWAPVAGRFRDYISQPKPNGYRSLHTTVIRPKGEKIEIQIRTKQMHRLAEVGIAAHWRYKEGESKISPIEEKQIKWLISSIESGEPPPDDETFPSEIYLFTPMGDVIALPNGATPLDFAYAIHTNVGHRTTGAIVNGTMVALDHKLNSGDTVKIITRPHQKPSKDWLEIAVTSRARAKIRSYLNAIERRQNIQKGREMVEKFLRDNSISLQKLERKGRLQKLPSHLKCSSMEEVFIKVATSKLTLEELYTTVFPKTSQTEEKVSIEERLTEPIQRDSGEVCFGDIKNLMVKFAKCCNPLPGDLIKGFITRGRGVTIHRKNCPNLMTLSPERIIDISWNTVEGGKARARLRIVTEEVPGILAKLTQFISSKGINITAAKSERKKDGTVVNLFSFEIFSTDMLINLIRSLERINGVIEIERI